MEQKLSWSYPAEDEDKLFWFEVHDGILELVLKDEQSAELGDELIEFAKACKGQHGVRSTDIEGIFIQVSPEGNHRIIDANRLLFGDIVTYKSIAVLEMPDDMKDPETGRGYWMHLTNYWDGYLPAETLLEVY